MHSQGLVCVPQRGPRMSTLGVCGEYMQAQSQLRWAGMGRACHSTGKWKHSSPWQPTDTSCKWLINITHIISIEVLYLGELCGSALQC